MIDIEKLKPLMKGWVSEDNMADAILAVSEIDEEMDTSAADELKAENERLKEQNKKLTDIFFTGKKETSDVVLPDEKGPEGENKEDDEPDKIEDLFETHEYKKGEDKLEW